MKTLVEYITEQLKSDSFMISEATLDFDHWSHHDKYDYAIAVIKDLFDGKEVALGSAGTGFKGIKSISLSDFDSDALDRILTDPSRYTNADFHDALNDDVKKIFGQANVWNNIWKAPYSGINSATKSSNVFEYKLCENLQYLIINNGEDLPEDAMYKTATMNLWNKISDNSTIKKLQDMNLTVDTINDYVFTSGKGTTNRNKYNQILNNETYEVNITKKCTVTNDTEEKVENVLTQSGKIIADITITLDGKQFSKSDINQVNSDDIYISCKDGNAQLSAISMQQPFYGYNAKTNGGNSYIIDCYRNGKSFEDFQSEPENICVVSFNNLCQLLGIDGKTIYDYFAKPKNERKRMTITISHKPNENNEVFATLIQLLVGGNYWYVNSNGEVTYVDDDIDKNNFTFIPTGTGYLEPSLIAVEGIVKTPEGSTKARIKFRSTDGGNYPYRLFFDPVDKHIVSKLYT